MAAQQAAVMDGACYALPLITKFADDLPFCTFFMQIRALRQFFMLASSNSAIALNSRAAKTAGAGIMIAAAMLSAPIAFEIMQAVAFADGRPVSPISGLQALWFMGAGALIVLAVFVYRIAKQVEEKSPHFLTIGANVFGLLIGVYLAFVVADQLAFYHSRNDTGMLSWALMKDDPSLQAIRCESDFLIVRGVDSETATYRCPAPLQLIYGRVTGTPMVPWPGFTEGTSAELAHAVKRLQNGAIYIQGTK